MTVQEPETCHTSPGRLVGEAPPVGACLTKTAVLLTATVVTSVTLFYLPTYLTMYGLSTTKEMHAPLLSVRDPPTSRLLVDQTSTMDFQDRGPRTYPR